ncbi:ABC transporter ATP-binding protein [Bacteroidia bacterium]|nr:ABC transporter ATP-binding protein [Bacteroidia bacterium]
MISGENISKFYGELQVLKSVNILIKNKEIVSITGPSGAGKSTLLQLLGTLDEPNEGVVKYDEIDISGYNSNQMANFRNNTIGFIFQFHHLLPEFSALENVCMPALIRGEKKNDAIQKATDLLTKLDLKNRIHHKPNELSGGEQQRVAVARALINNPKVIFADEPSGNLDTENANELHRLFVQLRDELGQTFVIVTHNNELASMADRILEMKDGKIINSITSNA